MKKNILFCLFFLAFSAVASPNVGMRELFPNLKFVMPVAMIQHPTADDRWYVVEQQGRVQELAKGQATLFADISDKVASGGEKGLLGFAFHPDFSHNGQLFFSYTAEQSGDLFSIVSRMNSKNGKPDLRSEQILLKVAQPYGNHNGGQIAFGRDGYLYIGLGDGGWAGDPRGHGQNRDTLLGALLRIDVNHADPYAIPADNPFATGGGRGEIYAYGLRNPWRWSFDQQTGDLWLADVGQDRYEEINRIIKGGNYGWNVREAGHCYNMRVCDTAGFIEPVHEYGRRAGKSVTGGYVYYGQRMAALRGSYLFGDFVSGRVWAMQTQPPNAVTLLLESGENISSFAQGRDGEIYLIGYMSGKIYQLVAEN